MGDSEAGNNTGNAEKTGIERVLPVLEQIIGRAGIGIVVSDADVPLAEYGGRPLRLVEPGDLKQASEEAKKLFRAFRWYFYPEAPQLTQDDGKEILKAADEEVRRAYESMGSAEAKGEWVSALWETVKGRVDEQADLIKRQREDLERRESEYRIGISRLGAQIDELSERLENETKRAESETNAKRGAIVYLADAEMRLKESATALSAWSNKYSILKRICNGIKHTSHIKGGKIERLEKRAEEEKKLLEEFGSKYRELIREHEYLKPRVAKLNEELFAAARQREELLMQYDELLMQTRDYEHEIDNLKAVHQLVEADARRKAERVSALEGETAELRNANRRSTEFAASLAQDKRTLEDNIEELARDLQTSLNENEGYGQRCTEAEERLERAMAGIREEERRLDRKRTGIEEEARGAREQIAGLWAKLGDTESRLRNAEEANQNLIDVMRQYTAENDALREETGNPLYRRKVAAAQIGIALFTLTVGFLSGITSSPKQIIYKEKPAKIQVVEVPFSSPFAGRSLEYSMVEKLEYPALPNLAYQQEIQYAAPATLSEQAAPPVKAKAHEPATPAYQAKPIAMPAAPGAQKSPQQPGGAAAVPAQKLPRMTPEQICKKGFEELKGKKGTPGECMLLKIGFMGRCSGFYTEAQAVQYMSGCSK